ncbi:MAG: hypothetical protein JXA68_11465 [Ignavibacteriales bacterium]|nr:hypothetical protein [Ignavibacteriales bacterium]
MKCFNEILIGEIIFFFIIIFLIFSCDAPRDNLFDPNNSDNKIYNIQGRVLTTKLPVSPLTNTSIYFQNGNLHTYSDNNGNFKIEGVSLSNSWIYFNKEGYFPDSLYIEWNNEKSKYLQVNLNSIQTILDLSFYSITINKYPDQQNYKFGIKLKINDDEGDVDSIFLSNNKLKFSRFLNFNSSLNQYEATFNFNEIGITFVGDLIGKDFLIEAKDLFLRRFVIGQTSIKRIIYQVIELREPINNQIVDSLQLFKWTRFQPGFQFHYKLEIYTNEVNPELIHTVDNISTNEIQYQSNKSLEDGEYFWVLWCVDEFGNLSQSKPATFKVQ